MPPQSRAEIMDRIASALSAIPGRLGMHKADSLWTHEVKSALSTLGVDLGWQVCASGYPDLKSKEWLYDLVWFQNDDSRHLAEVVLVAESEWKADIDEIFYDFEKLLVADAPLKLMIFQDTDMSVLEITELLIDGVRRYRKKRPDQLYIFAGFDSLAFQFRIRTITVDLE